MWLSGKSRETDEVPREAAEKGGPRLRAGREAFLGAKGLDLPGDRWPEGRWADAAVEMV